jgi:predicted DNA-binding transcriptional regulator YafY
VQGLAGWLWAAAAERLYLFGGSTAKCAIGDEANEPNWLLNGGLSTLYSYRVSSAFDIPPAHIEWLRSLPFFHDDGRRFFCPCWCTSSAIEANELRRLREKIIALVPRSKIARIETDHEALLEAQGLAARPGPTARLAPEIASAISMALKASQRLRIVYHSRGSAKSTARVVEPYGVLIGIRRYLVAKPKNDPKGPLQHYVAENIRTAEVTGEVFEREPGFDIDLHARKAFGAFRNDEKFGEVIWKFKPSAASHARAFLFHPSQVLEGEPDGSLIVRFYASGHLEMCWHLYMWGDQVEVLAPAALRKMVETYQRSDFLALP